MSKAIDEGNKLIAEFMNWQHHEDADYDKHEMANLKYHSSWDWLMPVVEKINYKTSEYNAQLWNLITDGLKTQKINDTWGAVIQFIQWYNQNKKA